MATFTLERFYALHFKPCFTIGWSARTFDAYDSTLRAWKRLTPNPTIERIDTRCLASFKAAAADATSAATVNKHLRHVGHLLSKAGPPGHRNRDALNLIKIAPWTKPLRERENDPRVVNDEDLAAWYHACRHARFPIVAGVSPPKWWRALACAALFLAARRGTLLGLKWSHLDLAGRVVQYGGELDKCGRRRSKTLHQVLVRHLLEIRAADVHVFPWPHSEQTYYREFRRLQDLAGIAEPFHLHDLKKTAATRGSASMDLFVLKEFCDHSTIATTEKHYANGRGRLAAAIDALPVPAAFAAAAAEDPQRRLFD